MTIKPKSLAVAIAVFTCLVLCELMTRLLAPPWLHQRMAVLTARGGSSDGVGTDRQWKVERKNGKFFSFTPQQSFDVLHDEYHIVAHIDELGGRRTVIDGNLRSSLIVMLGDSFTFGVGVKDTETFVNIIATRIPQYRFINLGVPGSALPQQLDILRERHDELRPIAYVFFFFLGNDFADILQTSNIMAYDPLEDFLRKVDDPICHSYLLAHSYSIQAICASLPISVVATRPWFELPRDPVFYVMDRSMARYQQLATAALANQLRILADLQRSMHFKSIIVAVPDVNQLSNRHRKLQADSYGVPFAQLEASRPNAILAREVQEAGLLLFDPTPCMGTSVREMEALYYRHDNHFRPLGHEIFANCATKEIAKLLSMEASK